MLLTPVAIVLGLVIGFARGGSFGPWRAMPVKLFPVLVAGLVLQVAAEFIDVPARAATAVVGWLLLAIVMGANLHLGGAGVAGLGMLANAVPILLNGAVPVRPDALVTAGRVDAADLERVQVSAPWELETTSTRLGVLGDVIPLRITDDIVSFGDLLVAAGLVFLVMNTLMQWAAGRRRRGPRPAPSTSVIDLVDEPAPGLDTTPASGVGAGSFLDELEPVGAEPAVGPVTVWDDEPVSAGLPWDDTPVIETTPLPSPTATATPGGLSIDEWLGEETIDLRGDGRPAADSGVLGVRPLDTDG